MSDSGFLVRDGVELKWSRGHLPIAVLLDESAADYLPEFEAAVEAFHGAVFGRAYFSIGPFMPAHHGGAGLAGQRVPR